MALKNYGVKVKKGSTYRGSKVKSRSEARGISTNMRTTAELNTYYKAGLQAGLSVADAKAVASALKTGKTKLISRTHLNKVKAIVRAKRRLVINKRRGGRRVQTAVKKAKRHFR